jgi:hypothetical protein
MECARVHEYEAGGGVGADAVEQIKSGWAERLEEQEAEFGRTSMMCVLVDLVEEESELLCHM